LETHTAVSQQKDPPERDRFPKPEEIDDSYLRGEGDSELRAFLVLAPVYRHAEGGNPRAKVADLDLDSSNSRLYVSKTKNDDAKQIQLPDIGGIGLALSA
jgi:hypothetical protein